MKNHLFDKFIGILQNIIRGDIQNTTKTRDFAKQEDIKIYENYIKELQESIKNEMDESESFKRDVKEELKKHKWIESKKAQHDMGKEAIEQWLKKFYKSCLRKHWLLHITGAEKILEFDEHFYNICNLPPLYGNPKTIFVLERLNHDGENWSILVEDQECVDVLSVLQINDWRIDPKKVVDPDDPELY